MHGLWLLLFVALVPALLRLVPISCLAALLVLTGCKLIDGEAIKKLWGYGKRLVVIYAATLTMIVCTDLLTGVLVGVLMYGKGNRAAGRSDKVRSTGLIVSLVNLVIWAGITYWYFKYAQTAAM